MTMPNCFCLYRRGDTTNQRVVFQQLDDDLCKHFGIDPDPVRYHHGWYDFIGLRLAIGWTMERIRQEVDADILCCTSTEDDWFKGACHMRDIVDWIDARFTSDAWYEHKS